MCHVLSCVDPFWLNLQENVQSASLLMKGGGGGGGGAPIFAPLGRTLEDLAPPCCGNSHTYI